MNEGNLRPFQPGNRANPGGRPAGLSRYIREQTADGAELVDFVLKILRNKGYGVRLKLEAATWLADRGWGRPPQGIALAMTGEGEVTYRVVYEDRTMTEYDDRVAVKPVDYRQSIRDLNPALAPESTRMPQEAPTVIDVDPAPAQAAPPQPEPISPAGVEAEAALPEIPGVVWTPRR